MRRLEQRLAPYAVDWDTTAAANGLHTLRAVARDAPGNRFASAVTITVANEDTPPPAISGVAASSVTSSGATMTWITDEASDSVLVYGPTTAYGSTSSSSAMVTAHSRTLTGLAANTQYHCRVKSTDASGNSAMSGDFSFTTLPAVSVSITAPSAGATVSGRIKVSATATAGSCIASVQFRLDGNNLGARTPRPRTQSGGTRSAPPTGTTRSRLWPPTKRAILPHRPP